MAPKVGTPAIRRQQRKKAPEGALAIVGRYGQTYPR